MASAPTHDDRQTERWRRVLDARTSRERGRRTLARLLDAAVAEFSAYGYHGARVARIAKRARTSHGSFYVYFKGKNDLVLAMQEEIVAEGDQLLETIPELQPDPAGFMELRVWLARVCDVFLEHAAVRSAILDAIIDDADPRISKVGLRAQQRWTTALADRIRAAGADDIDPYLAALSIDNLIDRATRSIHRGQLLLSFDELVDGAAELIHRSVFGSAEPSKPRPASTTP
jgi:AcrR family transcriptional regulator